MISARRAATAPSTTTTAMATAASTATVVAADRYGRYSVLHGFRYSVHGGHHVVRLFGMDGPQSVGRLPEVSVVVFSQYDVELLEQPLQEEILEEEAGLLSSGANFQHNGQQLRRFAAA